MSRPDRAFINDDLPTFGAPAMTKTRPSRTFSPRRLSARCPAISPCRAVISAATAGATPLRKVLVGKIDQGFLVREQLQQPGGPAAIDVAERTLHLADRLAPLRLRFGVHEVGDRFSLQQTDLAAEKRPARELARVRRPRAGRGQRRRDRVEHRPPAVEVKLRRVLPGVAAGGRGTTGRSRGPVRRPPGCAGCAAPRFAAAAGDRTAKPGSRRPAVRSSVSWSRRNARRRPPRQRSCRFRQAAWPLHRRPRPGYRGSRRRTPRSSPAGGRLGRARPIGNRADLRFVPACTERPCSERDTRWTRCRSSRGRSGSSPGSRMPTRR